MITAEAQVAAVMKVQSLIPGRELLHGMGVAKKKKKKQTKKFWSDKNIILPKLQTEGNLCVLSSQNQIWEVNWGIRYFN